MKTKIVYAVVSNEQDVYLEQVFLTPIPYASITLMFLWNW